jgi:hypothetical protein
VGLREITVEGVGTARSTLIHEHDIPAVPQAPDSVREERNVAGGRSYSPTREEGQGIGGRSSLAGRRKNDHVETDRATVRCLPILGNVKSSAEHVALVTRPGARLELAGETSRGAGPHRFVA